jgi:hypothetical protein
MAHFSQISDGFSQFRASFCNRGLSFSARIDAAGQKPWGRER